MVAKEGEIRGESLMFGKEIRMKLLELRPEKSLHDETTRDKDWKLKLKQKA